jgi:hypothetical protein
MSIGSPFVDEGRLRAFELPLLGQLANSLTEQQPAKIVPGLLRGHCHLKTGLVDSPGCDRCK